MYQHTLATLSTLLQNKSISSEELTRAYIERSESLNAELNCFISLTPERALEQARAADKRLQSGNAHALTGFRLRTKIFFVPSV